MYNTSASLYSLDKCQFYQARDCQSFDRKCMRCMLYNLEVQADDSYLSKDKFTKSFSPSDSYEDIFNYYSDECDAETKVLFCKSLIITSDEDEDRKGIKRTYEETRNRKCFKPQKKPRKMKPQENDPRSRRSSNFSLRSSRALKSPSATSGGSGTQKRFKPKSVRSSPPRSRDGSTITQTDESVLSHKSMRSAERIEKVKKTRGTENRRNAGNEGVAVYEKTIVTLTSSDNFLMGQSDQLKMYGRPRQMKNHLQNSKSVTKNLGHVKRYSGQVEPLQMPDLEHLIEDLCEESVPAPPSRVDIKVLPAIEEKPESRSARSLGLKKSDSCSLTESYTSSGSGFDSGHKPVSSAVKMNFANVRIRRKARLVIEKPGISKMYPNSCMKKKGVKSATSKQTQKKSVTFLIDENENTDDSSQKKSARLEKYPDQMIVKPSKSSRKRKTPSDTVAAPVVLSVQEMSAQQGSQTENKIMNTVAQGGNVHEQLVNNFRFFQSFHDYDRGVFALLTPRIPLVQPQSVTITELKQDVPLDQPQSMGNKRINYCANENKQIIHAISDMVMAKLNKPVNDHHLMSKKAISAGPTNSKSKRESRLQQESLEEMRKQIRLRLERKAEDEVKTDADETEFMGGSPSKVDTSGQLRSRRSPDRATTDRATRNPQVGQLYHKQILQTSGNGPVYSLGKRSKEETEITQKYKARSDVMKNFGGSRDNPSENVECPQSSGTDCPTEGSPTSEYVSFESTGGETQQAFSTRRPRSQRPPSRRPHLISSSRRAFSANTKPPKYPGPPRTLLTMQMKSKADPNTTSTIRQHLGSEIPNADEEPGRNVTRLIPSTRTFDKQKLALLRTHKLAGHPLQNRTLADFLAARERERASQKLWDSDRLIGRGHTMAPTHEIAH